MAMTKDQAAAFFAKVKPEDDGLLPVSADRDTAMDAYVASNQFDQLKRFLVKIEKAAEARGKAQAQSQGISFKVGRAGSVCVYGLGQMPLSVIYAAGWKRLLAKADELIAFIDSNPIEFWPATPERKFRGKLIAAAPAVVVRLSKERGDNNVVATGEAAVTLAKQKGIYREHNANNGAADDSE